MSNKQFIRVHALAEMLSVSRSTIWRWVHEKKDFPQPIRLSKGITVWSVEEIQSWVTETVNSKTREHGSTRARVFLTSTMREKCSQSSKRLKKLAMP